MGESATDSSLGVTERLSEWSFMVSVASGLSWGDLINTAPTTTVLIKEGLSGFAAKTKTRWKSEGRPSGGYRFFFSDEKWLSDGFVLFRNNTGDSPRDFWIGQPLVSESELDSLTKSLRFGIVRTK